MTIRKFDRDSLDREPDRVRYRDLYPTPSMETTPFGASLVVIEPGGATMLHHHQEAESFFIHSGTGEMCIDGLSSDVTAGDVVYLKPTCEHTLRNASTTEDLVFLSVYWTADAPKQRISAERTAPILILPSPPTANGPLHLGHLAGPYLMADVYRRYFSMRGVDAAVALIADEHQSYVTVRAEKEGRPVDETTADYTQRALRTLSALGANPDAHYVPSKDPDYQASVQRSFQALVTSGHLIAEEAATLFCETCDRVLFDGFVAGDCPHCGEVSNGSGCCACLLPNDAADLIGATCTRCGERPAERTMRRWFLPLDGFGERLAEYHASLALPPKLRAIAARLSATEGMRAPASQVDDLGIPVGLPDFEGQVVSPWLEVALATHHLRACAAPDSDVVHFFGFDNAFLYLIHDPVVSLALDASAPLPTFLGPNDFLMVDDQKISKSDEELSAPADTLLERVPRDLARLCLAMTRPEQGDSTGNLETMIHSAASLQGYWEQLVAGIAKEVLQEVKEVVPPAWSWSEEHHTFLALLRRQIAEARAGYERGRLRPATGALMETAQQTVSFLSLQSHLDVEGLLQQRSTGMALTLVALKAMAMIAAPIMPRFAAGVWFGLGYDDAPSWSDEIGPLPAGHSTRLELLTTRSAFEISPA